MVGFSWQIGSAEVPGKCPLFQAEERSIGYLIQGTISVRSIKSDSVPRLSLGLRLQ